MISTKQWLSIIVVTSFLLSLGYSFAYRINPTVDARAYDVIAKNIVDGFGFREDLTVPLSHDPVILRAGPAYEYFLAGSYGIFGHRFEPVWVLQALLHALTALILFLIARKLFPERGEIIGLVAAGTVAFHPDLIEISAMLMTETLYLFLEVLSLYFFSRLWKGESSLYIVTALGVVSGLAILARPPLILFVPIFLFFLWSAKRKKEACVLLAMTILVLVPWTVRNYHAYGLFLPTTMITEYNLWVGNTALADGGQISGGYNPATTYGTKEGYLGFQKAARGAFLTFVVREPVRFLKLTIIRAIRFLSIIRPMGFWFYESGIPQLIFVSLSLVAIATLFIIGTGGVGLLYLLRHPFAGYLTAFLLASIVVLLPAVVQSRYRFQVYPLLALAGGVWVAYIGNVRAMVLRVLCWSAISFMIFAIIDAVSFYGTIVERLRTLFS